MSRTYTDTPEPRYVEKAKESETTSVLPEIKNTDRGKFLKVKANKNELMFDSIPNEVPTPLTTDRGKTLKVKSDENAYALVAEPSVPTPALADENKVLSVDNTGAYALVSKPNIPIPEVTDEGKVIGVDSTGAYVLVNPPKPSSEVEEKQINFYDYEGTRLYSYTTQEWSQVTELPANPDRTSEGLTAQGWNWTKTEIDEQLAVLPKGDVNVGQSYTTASGATEIDIEILDDNTSGYLRCVLYKKTATSQGGTATVDWGDGSPAEEITGLGYRTTGSFHAHTYINRGSYTIKISVDEGSMISISGSKGAGSVEPLLSSKNAPFASSQHSDAFSASVRRIRIGDGVASVGTAGFMYLFNLESISFPLNVPVSGDSIFGEDVRLSMVVIPRIEGSSSIGVPSLSNSYLKYFSAPPNIKYNGFPSCENCTQLRSITVPKAVTQLSQYTFKNCYTLRCLDLSAITSVAGIDVFSNLYALEDLRLPNIANLLNGFTNANSLRKLTIPSNCTGILSNTFTRLYSLVELHLLPSSPPTLNSGAFSNLPATCVIYVPTASLTDYQGDSNWSSYAAQMVGE